MASPFARKLQSLMPLSDDAITALESTTRKARRFPAKTDLIREGDEPGPTFVVLEGWACRYKILPNGLRQITAFLMPGDACDLNVGLLKEMDHSIQTLSAATVAMIERDTMAAMMGKHQDLARAMYVAQLTDEGILRAWITSMGRRSSIERVAHLTCELYARAYSIGLIEDEHFEMPLSQSVLADALGMTPVHMNRTLRELRERGAMRIRRNAIMILDPIKLIDTAGFDENYLHRRGVRSLKTTDGSGLH